MLRVTIPICYVLMCYLPFGSLAQPPAAAPVNDARLDWLTDNATPIKSIDPTLKPDDFADLQFLKTAIGDSRIVQLGEQSHGDGAVFLAKDRLIRFLHEQMGFDVLVWESGMFDCREADRSLRKPENDLEVAWREGVFGIWAAAAQVKPLLEYIRASYSTDSPLEMAGYDCQFSGGRPERWLDSMRTFLEPLGENHPVFRVLDALKEDPKPIVDGSKPPGAIEGAIQGLENLGQLVDTFKAPLVARHGAAEVAFMRRTIDDAAATARASLVYARARTNKGEQLREDNPRDQRMGENLIWLAREKYKGRKLIVWAASMHQVHEVRAIRPTFNPDMYKDAITAGTIAHKTLGQLMYTIGFETYDGEAGRWFAGSGPIATAPKGSLAQLLSNLDGPFYFIDFRGLPREHWLRGKVTMRPLGYAPMDTDWTRQLDGIFYIRTMFPATRQKMAPDDAVITVK